MFFSTLSIEMNQLSRPRLSDLLNQLNLSTVPTLMLWQVLGELVQQLRRWKDQGRLTHPEYLAHDQSFRHAFPLQLPTADVFDRAVQLSERYSLSHWDSMLLGACQSSGVTTLYTEDMGAPRLIESVTLVNPF
jgi:predicted nucleic acid-binding protein